MEKEAKCRGCKNIFITKSGTKHYCSEECKSNLKTKNFAFEKFTIYLKCAKKRNIEFNITFDDFLLLWKKPCTYCGGEIESIGIDREDNTKGYIIGNIVPCCAICNLMKTKHTKIDFISHCKKIHDFNVKNTSPKERFVFHSIKK